MSNCYNQPCQWSTDNRTLRRTWTMSFSPSWVSGVMWRLQLFSPCCSHTLEVTTELALGWEQQEGRDEQHFFGWTLWFDMAAWLEKGLPSSLLCSAPVLCHRVKGLSAKSWTGAFGGHSSVWFSTKELSVRPLVFAGCLYSSLVGNSAAGIVIHPCIYIYNCI